MGVVDKAAAAFELVKAHNDRDQTELLSQPSFCTFVRRPKEGLKMRAALHCESASTQWRWKDFQFFSITIYLMYENAKNNSKTE